MHLETVVLETIDRRARLRRALAKLNNNYQRLAVVLYLMGYNQGEIADVYGCSRQNIQQIVRQFKQRNGMQWRVM